MQAQNPLESQTQKPEEGAQASAQGGSGTGGVFPPVLDAHDRPITAGDSVKNGPKIFEDIAVKAGLTHWQHRMGTPEKRYILETTESGVALLDFDHDGWLDVYLVNGSVQAALGGQGTLAVRRAPP